MRTKIALAVCLVIILLLSFPALRRIGEVLADRKPGPWGIPSWYILLIVCYVILVLVLLFQALVFALREESAWRQWVMLLVGLTLVRGLLYSSITPPWQSPDEHSHFEYAALMGRLRRVPTPADISSELQQQIVSSMFQYDLWRLIQREPVVSPPVGFLRSGGVTREPPTHVIDNRYLYYPQVGRDPPLYYVAPAVVYAALPGQDIALQLYLMRLTTVLTLVALIGIAVWATRQLFDEDIPLAMSIPTLVAFIPMLAHIGSVLNNDTLAAVLATILLGMLVTILRHGLNWPRGLALVAVLALGIFAKKTMLWTIPLAGSLGLVYVIRHRIWARYVVLAVGIGVLSLMLLSMRVPSEQVRYWKPASSPWGATAVRRASPDGAYALRVAGGPSEDAVLGQQLPTQTALDLRGHTITLSAQVRSDEGEQQGGLAVIDLDQPRSFRTDLTAGPQWRNATFQFRVPDDALHLRVVLTSASQSTVYFDRVEIEDLSEPGADTVLLRNDSGEQIRSAGEVAMVEAGEWLGLGGNVQSVFDPWQDDVEKLFLDPWPIRLAFESFFGNFGAALVVPLPALAYRILGFVCILAVIGIGWRAVGGILIARKARLPGWKQGSFLTLGAALFFASCLVFAPLLFNYGHYTPQGRYLFPVVWPIGVFLTMGWAQLMPGSKSPWLLVLVSIGAIALDATALYRMASYFYDL